MPELSFYERQHIQKILIQQGAIGNIFNQFSREISGYLRKWTETGKLNVWVRNSSVEKGIDRSLLNLQKSLLDNIQSFGVDAWQRGQVKNDDLVERYIKGMSISSVVKDGMFYRNKEALKAFLNRADNGMTLSDRVWKTVEITKDQVELFLGSGLSVGRAAGEISSDVRQLLKKPDKRFRRVRDKNGRLQLSTPMKDYHPGQGVYRSSYMNALRLSATNTNINFRQADHDRWQKMDFILGIEVKRSASNHGSCKICDAMKGKYPKDFVFTGWHPFCICFSIPIMMDHEEFADYLLDDKVSSDKIIRNIPDSAQKYVNDNYESAKRTFFVQENKDFFSQKQNSFSSLITKAKQLGIDTRRYEDSVAKNEKYASMISQALEIDIRKAENDTIAKKKLYDSVEKKENEIRMNAKFETSVGFDSNGNVILDKRGRSRSVRFTSEECKMLKDAVVTHNHPGGWAYPENSIMRIGSSFSPEDIAFTIGNDLSEFRAVTPNYTFVIKRPATGWGVSVSDINKSINELNRSITKENKLLIKKGLITPEHASVTHWHKLNRELSQKYGWSYTKKKTR